MISRATSTWPVRRGRRAIGPHADAIFLSRSVGDSRFGDPGPRTSVSVLASSLTSRGQPSVSSSRAVCNVADSSRPLPRARSPSRARRAHTDGPGRRSGRPRNAARRDCGSAALRHSTCDFFQELGDLRASAMKNFTNIQVDESNILTWQGLILPVRRRRSGGSRGHVT